MADVDNINNAEPEIASGNNSSDIDNPNTDESYINDRMVEVSNLVMLAKLQAKEAEIRSRYAREFANRAVAEALAAHQVSASLAKTSRMVAALALEFSNETNLLNESFVDSESDSRYSSFLSADVSLQSAGDLGALSNIACFDDSTNNGIAGQVNSGSVMNKYDTQFPENVDVNHVSGPAEKPLSTVYEDSTNEQKPDSDVKAENKSNPDLAEELKNLEIRRKMMLYRDSKLLPCNFTRVTNEEPAIQHTYTEQATQTNIVV